jgi:hypothetical protein
MSQLAITRRRAPVQSQRPVGSRSAGGRGLVE